jgi:membrane fusion protein (multidrug efflux system)
MNAFAVPQIAVMDGAQGKFVYVVDKDKDGKDIASVRPITLGEWVDAPDAKDGNLWIVESGVKTGDRVIVDGVAKLRPGAPIMLGGVPGAPGSPPGGAAPPAKDKDASPAGNAPAKKS